MTARAPCRGGQRLLLPLVALVVLGGAGCSPEGRDTATGVDGVGRSERAREMAPEFSLEGLDGDTVALGELRGKTVIVDFWATWCPPCEFQVPELNAFWSDHRADGDIAVYGISVDEGGPEVVRSWVEDKQVGYPILLGDSGLARSYGALGFPTLIIISPDGSIDSRHVGLIERASLEDALERQRSQSAPVDSGATPTASLRPKSSATAGSERTTETAPGNLASS